MMTQTQSRADAFASNFWILAGIITLIRVFGLMLSQANLGPDEVQYWYWSRDLSFGYFSKPPLIAWSISVSTFIFGNAEWAVRLPAPLFHWGAASFLFMTARRLYGDRVAFWVGFSWLLLPGAALSSFLIATDAPLMFFWSASLFLFFRLLEPEQKQRLLDAVLLGVTIGLAFLSKYAGLYLFASIAAAMVVQPSVRKALLGWPIILVMVVALSIMTPNILWNIDNDFQTVGHTVENANWGASLLHPGKFATFLGSQVGIFGLLLPIALWGAWRARKNANIKFGAHELTLAAFTLVPLLIVSAQAFISRAHANWAASAYPAATLLVVWLAMQLRWETVLRGTALVHAGIAAMLLIALTNFGLIDWVGASRAIDDIRGWEKQTKEIIDAAEGYDVVMIDDRGLIGETLYYQRRANEFEIVAWDPNARINNHYEAFIPFDPNRHDRVIFVTTRDDDAHVNYRFRSIQLLGAIDADLNGATRTFHYYDIADYFGPGARIEN